MRKISAESHASGRKETSCKNVRRDLNAWSVSGTGTWSGCGDVNLAGTGHCTSKGNAGVGTDY